MIAKWFLGFLPLPLIFKGGFGFRRGIKEQKNNTPHINHMPLNCLLALSLAYFYGFERLSDLLRHGFITPIPRLERTDQSMLIDANSQRCVLKTITSRKP